MGVYLVACRSQSVIYIDVSENKSQEVLSFPYKNNSRFFIRFFQSGVQFQNEFLREYHCQSGK